MPVIRIDDATWERLKRWAEPLEDTPADALRRLLDYAERRRGLRPTTRGSVGGRRLGAPKLPRGQKLPQSAYYRPILESLYELGGKGRVDDVLTLVGQKVDAILGEVDKQPLSTGGIRWRNTAQWARYDLVNQGLLRKDSQRGVWELTNAGLRAVERAGGQS